MYAVTDRPKCKPCGGTGSMRLTADAVATCEACKGSGVMRASRTPVDAAKLAQRAPARKSLLAQRAPKVG